MTTRKAGHPRTTPELETVRRKKLLAIVEWLRNKKNADVQQFNGLWGVAISRGAHAKPLLLLLRAQDFWHWHTKSTRTMNDEGCTFDEALEKNYPQTRPVKSEAYLRRKLDELSGKANHVGEREDGETDGQ